MPFQSKPASKPAQAPQGDAAATAHPAAGKTYADGAAALKPEGVDDGGGDKRSHVVQPGETLWELATEYLGAGTQWIRLWVANKDKVPNAHALQPGTVLVIPDDQAAPPAPADPAAPAPAQAAAAAVHYTVRGGDSLSSIAATVLGDAGRWRELWDANRDTVPNPNHIRVGQVLVVPGSGEQPAPAPPPVADDGPAAPEPPTPTEPAAPEGKGDTYTVQSGDTLSGIAAKVLGSAGKWHALWQANKATVPNPNAIKVGQVLQLPDGAQAPAGPGPDATPQPGPDAGPDPGAERSDGDMAPDGPLAVGSSPLEKQMANLYNSKGKLIAAEAGRLGIEPGVAAACMAIESGGTGFRNGKMVIRFEAHIFEQYAGQSVSVQHTGAQADEYKAFDHAKALDFEAAHDSISMGAAQIMGFNAERVGYANAVDMYQAFVQSEAAQFAGMFDFVRTSKGLLAAARGRDWATFAMLYNGAGYKANAYDAKLAGAYAAWQKVCGGLPYG